MTLSPLQQFAMTIFMKLILNMPIQDLAYLCDIARSHIRTQDITRSYNLHQRDLVSFVCCDLVECSS